MLTAFTYNTINNSKAFSGIKILTSLCIIFKWWKENSVESLSSCNDDAYICLAINDAVISLMQKFPGKEKWKFKERFKADCLKGLIWCRILFMFVPILEWWFAYILKYTNVSNCNVLPSARNRRERRRVGIQLRWIPSENGSLFLPW